MFIKISAVILIILIVLVGFSHKAILNSLPDSEFTHKWRLYIHASDVEMLIKEAEKTPYNAIHFQKDPKYEFPYDEPHLSNNAYIREGEFLQEVEDPDIQNFIDAAESTGLPLVRLFQRRDGLGWGLYHGLSWGSRDNRIDAFYLFGSAPKNMNCDKLDEGQDPAGNCHTHLFGKWYLDKWWSTD